MVAIQGAFWALLIAAALQLLVELVARGRRNHP